MALLISKGTVEVTIRYAESTAYNEEYVTEPDIYTYDDDKIFLNYTGYYAVISATMGEYIIDSGISIQIPFCEILDFGAGAFVSLLGFTDDNCPPKPGVYGNEAYLFPTEEFGDDFPSNQYKVVVEFINENEYIMALSIFFDIK
ncbi:Protein of unknown function [Cotesia congregata]|uniref:Uncharacterized protein n=1 Tax=Cotesia congregata TaxID=51543 RepID=A0A8J2HH09_COTCN|nr:Protein of unknown function [Cotesia congregata]